MSTETNNKLLKIGDIANLAKVTPRTIRYYEELGLLTPSEISSGGFRLYTENDLLRLMFIKRFKDLDFSLEEIRKLLKGIDLTQSKEEKIKIIYHLLEEEFRQISYRVAELEKSQLRIKKAMYSLEICKNCSLAICPSECVHKKSLLE
ncbi:MerR family transcriptional regulator [Sporomusa sp. KB1]|uniref:helix-turn-helix domain-containing protein n=1 Tax=Sporomusa sp. KB1 TaxID=943346 RepID=UPI0011A1A6F0|nr:MerR family transcriptional regulator [Sporomusa sp. KB1]TWH47719.1 MerR family Zn(II)-responsive transcriptional regulator of zntA [Sporomusa sp. KB1]